MEKIKSVARIKDPYVKRILSNIIGKDAFNIYCQTPSRLSHFTRGLSDSQLKAAPAKGKWSIAQIITHLYDSELVMGFRYRMAVAQSGTPLQAFDENKWAENLRYNKANAKEKLRLFLAMRKDHITFLQSLTPAEWKRYGMHQERGKETIERMVQMIAGHDINHLKQIKNLASHAARSGR
jgi:DinB family protein